MDTMVVLASSGVGPVLNLLDQLLRDLFIATVPEITTDAQVGFQPPDDAWHTFVGNLGTQLALNVYLIDLRENRKLRQDDRVRSDAERDRERDASLDQDGLPLPHLGVEPRPAGPGSSRRSTSTTSSSRSSRRSRGSSSSTRRGCTRPDRPSSTPGPRPIATARC